MNKRSLYIIWAGSYIFTGLLGFITEPNGLVKALMILCAILFFVPPALILKQGDTADFQRIRNLSIIYLAGTAVLLVCNMASVLGSEAMGTGLYALLTLLSAPMVCGQYWVLSLFLWACLMMVSLKQLKK